MTISVFSKVLILLPYRSWEASNKHSPLNLHLVLLSDKLASTSYQQGDCQTVFAFYCHWFSLFSIPFAKDRYLCALSDETLQLEDFNLFVWLRGKNLIREFCLWKFLWQEQTICFTSLQVQVIKTHLDLSQTVATKQVHRSFYCIRFSPSWLKPKFFVKE